MSINNYGVWVAKPVRVSAERAEDDPSSPHIHLFYDDGTGGAFGDARRASINVKSQSALSELVFWLVPDLAHPIVEALRGLEAGFHKIPSAPGGAALDYIRGNLIDLEKGRVLPHDQPGARDDIVDFVMPELTAAINRNATVYLFGEPYSDKEGIHDVHMNQGSQGQFSRYNGIWQDGGVIIHYPDEDRFSALLLAFASQAVHTDETSGNALPGSRNLAELIAAAGDGSGDGDTDSGGTDGGATGDGTTIPDDRRVAIIAALVNPVGGENTPGATGQPETVYLLNRSAKGVSLGGWSLLNKNDEAHLISGDVWLAPGAVQPMTLGQVALSNKGGLITLLDPDGHKVDGVSYTKQQAKDEGELVIFR